jgi:hypothetical protein
MDFRFNGQNSLVLPCYSPIDMSEFPIIVWLICCVCVLRQSCCKCSTYLVHRSFYRKLNLCCAVFGFVCVTIFFLFNTPWTNKKKDKLEHRKLELIEKLESGVSITCVCEESGHLDLIDIHQCRTPPPPPFSPLNRGYTVLTKRELFSFICPCIKSHICI